jgi:hypothetical protein
MTDHTEDHAGGEEESEGEDRSLPLPRLNPYGDYPKVVGPLTVERTLDSLSLRRENAGGLGWEAYVFFGIAMLAITLIGFMGMMQGDATVRTQGLQQTPHAFSPTNNHFALLWIITVILLLVGVPIYIKKAYNAALIFQFDKAAGALFENKRRIVPLRRIEHIAIKESRDPDDRYLYLLQVIHSDGYDFLIYNGYEEREVMILASEIAGFLDCRTRFTGTKPSGSHGAR